MVTTVDALTATAQVRLEQRRQVLVDLRAGDAEILELLAYNQNIFDHDRDWDARPEAHVAIWREYLADAAELGVWESLRRRLVQLRWPISAGLSDLPEYRDSTRRGLPIPDRIVGLELRSPERLELFIHETWAGPIPVIFAGDRVDFERLVQALSRRNEPLPIPAAMGACMVAGLNNWDRVERYRTEWVLQGGTESWEQAWQRLLSQKELYQDRLMILSDSPYSNVAASELGLTDDVWRNRSRQIRLEHESIHYWTKRCLGAMQNNVLDELIADYWGLVRAMGDYRADWFLYFLGLESYPQYRSDGRLGNYRGKPQLSDGAFGVLQDLVVAAARNLEAAYRSIGDRVAARYLVLVLSYLTLEQIASGDGVKLLTGLAIDLQNNSGKHNQFMGV
ncbi:MAG: hypothetical protein LH474_08175 [Chamaesiphon sp.]|nr:hypothetical protein [Chamaesiphon sp.]